MDKFCVITNREKDDNMEITQKIVEYMRNHEKSCHLLDNLEPDEQDYHYTDSSNLDDDTECAIVLGGDGTIIQAAYDLAGKNIPILGVNLGTLGFLAEIEKHNIYHAIDRLYDDDYKLENRIMLDGTITRDGKVMYEGYSLNDIVITRSGFSRIICVSVYVNDELIDKFRGDGVIISTPTGSTGYNLSSGGPVVKPTTRVMLITPICAHSLNARTIIVSENDKVTVIINRAKKTQQDEAIATFDGRKGISLQAEDIIEIFKAKEETQLVKIGNNSFFDILRTKIGQGGE